MINDYLEEEFGFSGETAEKFCKKMDEYWRADSVTKPPKNVSLMRRIYAGLQNQSVFSVYYIEGTALITEERKTNGNNLAMTAVISGEPDKRKKAKLTLTEMTGVKIK